MNKIKYFRLINKYKQKDIAKYLRITQPNYSNIEQGKVKLNIDYAKLLATLYKVSLSDIIDENKLTISITIEDFEKLIEIKQILNNLEKKYKNYLKSK